MKAHDRIQSPSRRGAATVMAIVVMGVLASVFMALTVVAHQEFIRTRAEVHAAQIEQLQLAMIVHARSQLDGNAVKDGPVALPATDVTAALQWEAATDRRACTARVTTEQLSSARRLVFARVGDRWMLELSEPLEHAAR